MVTQDAGKCKFLPRRICHSERKLSVSRASKGDVLLPQTTLPDQFTVQTFPFWPAKLQIRTLSAEFSHGSRLPVPHRHFFSDVPGLSRHSTNDRDPRTTHQCRLRTHSRPPRNPRSTTLTPHLRTRFTRSRHPRTHLPPVQSQSRRNPRRPQTTNPAHQTAHRRLQYPRNRTGRLGSR